MITNRQELNFYLESDRKALGIKYKRPRLFADEIWKFQRSLRRLEYYTNCSMGGDFLRRLIEKYRFHQLSLKLGFSIPINVFGPGLGDSSLWINSCF